MDLDVPIEKIKEILGILDTIDLAFTGILLRLMMNTISAPE
jgi:hypothetical protein